MPQSINDNEVYDLLARDVARRNATSQQQAKVDAANYRMGMAIANNNQDAIDRRARNGDIEALPQHYWTQDERSAMAPILAKREAAAQAAEGQRVKELQAANPYRYQLEQLDKNPNADGLNKIKPGSTGEAGYLARMIGEQRANKRAQLQAMADTVDAANDPYNKVVEAQRQRLEAQQDKESQRQQREQDKAEAAARGITSMHGSETGREHIVSLGGPDALKAAEDVARANIARTIQRAGGSAPGIMGESDENLRKIRAGMAAGS